MPSGSGKCPEEALGRLVADEDVVGDHPDRVVGMPAEEVRQGVAKCTVCEEEIEISRLPAVPEEAAAG